MEKSDFEIILIFNSNTSVFPNLESVLKFIKENWKIIHYLSIRKVWSGSRILKQLKGELPKIEDEE